MNFARLMITAILFTSTSSPAAVSENGWDNGNAGDIYGAEFVLTGRDLVARLRLLDNLAIAGLDPDALNGVILGTTLRSEEHVILDGFEVDAANYPAQKLIKLNRSRWREYRAPEHTRRRLLLVLHEYLYIMSLDDTNFVLSEKLISLLNVDNYSPGRWWNPLNPTNTISVQLVFNPAGCKLPLIALNPTQGSETLDMETGPECGEAYRRLRVEKASYTSSPASGYRGNFHRFEISVFGKDGQMTGAFSYEPKWGVCLLPQDGSCQLSGQIQSGGLSFSFWFLRN